MEVPGNDSQSGEEIEGKGLDPLVEEEADLRLWKWAKKKVEKKIKKFTEVLKEKKKPYRIFSISAFCAMPYRR